jgi:hypothetical protein
LASDRATVNVCAEPLPDDGDTDVTLGAAGVKFELPVFQDPAVIQPDDRFPESVADIKKAFEPAKAAEKERGNVIVKLFPVPATVSAALESPQLLFETDPLVPGEMDCQEASESRNR